MCIQSLQHVMTKQKKLYSWIYYPDYILTDNQHNKRITVLMYTKMREEENSSELRVCKTGGIHSIYTTPVWSRPQMPVA